MRLHYFQHQGVHQSLPCVVAGIILVFIPPDPALAYGPFALPIHDNSVEINGGAWKYSASCSPTSDHSGFDFDGEEGDPVFAAAGGTVLKIKKEGCPNTCTLVDEKCTCTGSWGCYVDIAHDVDEDGVFDYTTKYAHLKEGSISVSDGDRVTINTQIGDIGNTGSSCGAHLHFGVQDFEDCQRLDPICWLDPYNLYNDATCCDIPNGCPAENASAHTEFDCSTANNQWYLWASCPPTYNDTCSPTTSTYDVRMVTIQDNVVSSWYHMMPSANNPTFQLYDSVITDTASNGELVNWQVSNVDGDDFEDLIQVTKTDGPHTYAWVYAAAGDGTFTSKVEWKRTSTKTKFAFVADVDDDATDPQGQGDLILGYRLGNLDSTVAEADEDKIVWKICRSTGASFDVCIDWTTDNVVNGYSTFGDGNTDTFVVGDLDGDGRAELLRGRPDSACADGTLTWKRLTAISSTTATIKECWGYPDSQFKVADVVDSDGAEELLHIRTDPVAVTNGEIKVFVGHLNSSETLDTSPWADDVGNTDGWYYLADVNYDSEVYPDLVRWSTSTLAWMENLSASGFEGQSGAETLVDDLARGDDDRILFGYFGKLVTASDICIQAEPPPNSNSCDMDDDLQVVPACGGLDCDDTNASIYYGAVDTCGNGVDDDCVGGDVPCAEVYCTDHADNDLDGLIDCDDSDCADESTCLAEQPGCDQDGDSFAAISCGGDDCNDDNASIYYGAAEVCGNGVDDDCVGGDVPCTEVYCEDQADNDLDGRTDCDDADCAPVDACLAEAPGCDVDQDGSASLSCGGTDCNDGNSSIYPGVHEVCGNNQDDDCIGGDVPCTELYCTDGSDNDLDGMVDCADTDCVTDTACIAEQPGCDDDSDGQGASSCGGDDCDDLEPTIYYGAPEVCGNGIDDDCVGGEVPCDEVSCTDQADNDLDGLVDCNDGDCTQHTWCIAQLPGCDEDDDNYGAASCGGDDCNDANASVYYGAPEVCGNNVDDDCVGGDVPCSETYCIDGTDNDLDGLKDCDDPDCAADSTCIAQQPGCDQDSDEHGATSCGGNDCDDGNALIHPDAVDVCENRVDEDCSGSDATCTDDQQGAYGCVLPYTDTLGPSIDACLALFEDLTGVMMDDFDGDGVPDQLWILSPRILHDEELCFLDPDYNDVGDVECNEWGDGTANDTDDDGDSYTEQAGDRDDRSPNNYPGAVEICGDAFDNNLDLIVDETCALP